MLGVCVTNVGRGDVYYDVILGSMRHSYGDNVLLIPPPRLPFCALRSLNKSVEQLTESQGLLHLPVNQERQAAVIVTE
jgi:hypothetical protein